MKERKLGFLIAIGAVPLAILVLLLALNFASFSRLPVFSEYGDGDQKDVLENGLEINIVQEDQKVTFSPNQPTYTVYHRILYNSEDECPEYAPDDIKWRTGDAFALLGDAFCYAAVEDSGGSQSGRYELVIEKEAGRSDSWILTVVRIMLSALFVLTAIFAQAYTIYWFFQTQKELEARGAESIPNALLLIVPLVNIYYIYKYAKGAEKITQGRQPMFLSLLLFLLGNSILFMILCQMTYNEIE